MQTKIYIIQMVLLVVPVLFSLTIHEYAHGLSAYILGDPTPKLAGRITLNPLRHLTVVGTLFLFFTRAFGWARPVPVSPGNLINPKSDMLVVAIAGPLSNALLAVVSAGIFHLLPESSPSSFVAPISAMLQLMVSINIALALINLIPIPPLDGSKVIECLLPEKYMRLWLKSQPAGIIILIALLLTGVLSKSFLPLISSISSLLL